MVVIYGTRLYGKCDRWPGAFYVVTKFAHLNFVPLFPTESWIVLEGTESGGSFRGVKMQSLAAKSVLFGWFRAFCVIAALVAGFATLVSMQPRPENALVPGFCAAGAVIGFALTHWLGAASPERARQLALEARFPPVAVDAILAGRGWMGGFQEAAKAAEAARPKVAPKLAAPNPAAARPAAGVPTARPVAPPKPKPQEEEVTMEMLEAMPFVEEEKA